MSLLTGFELRDLSRTENRTYRPTPTGPLTVWVDQYLPGTEFFVEYVSVKVVDGVLHSVAIAGPRRNRDGKPSKSLRGRHNWSPHTFDKLPDWLRPIVADTPKRVDRGR